MFFSVELLSRRDSGFGLLWLASTLGPKSSFKKLPRRSVMTADISELCNLIAEPPEPLALRLSSNLMVGAVRVYKIKQEFLLADATTCSNTLKKSVQEMHAFASTAGQLQMGQPTVRPDAVTAVADPTVAFALDFDHLFGGWDEPRSQVIREEESDEEYNPSGAGKQARKGRKKASSISVAEQGRADLHTLQEDHGYLLSSSLDDAFQDIGGVGPSSSQFGGFRFDDNFLEGVDLGEELGAELAWELGEGHVASPIRHGASPFNTASALNTEIAAPGYGDIEFGLQDVDQRVSPGAEILMVDDFPVSVRSAQDPIGKPGVYAGDDEVLGPEGSIILPLSPLGTQDAQAGDENQGKGQRKHKRVRLLLDARTELTNEELERARANYLEGQTQRRRDLEHKKAEKESAKLIEDMIWGAPRGVEASVLVDFWQENFRIQVQARSGRLHLVTEGEPPRKRHKTAQDAANIDGREMAELYDWDRPLEDVNPDIGADMGGGNYGQNDMDIESRMRSSEEPGQGRRVSRPPSVLGSQFELGAAPLHEFPSGSQRSNVFPWDHAGVSSSISGAGPFAAGGGSDKQSFVRADSRLRGSSLGRDSVAGGVPESPASFGLTPSHRDNAFEFDVPAEDPAMDTQLSDASMMTLERNSYNFLEFAKIQLNAFPYADSTLAFDNVVPVETSTRHVAAAAFYHCLVLATKDLLSVNQTEPYGPVQITIV